MAPARPSLTGTGGGSPPSPRNDWRGDCFSSATRRKLPADASAAKRVGRHYNDALDEVGGACGGGGVDNLGGDTGPCGFLGLQQELLQDLRCIRLLERQGQGLDLRGLVDAREGRLPDRLQAESRSGEILRLRGIDRP